MSTCKGTVGFDGMTHYHNQAFSTFDSDNDQAKDKNCALSFKVIGYFIILDLTEIVSN